MALSMVSLFIPGFHWLRLAGLLLLLLLPGKALIPLALEGTDVGKVKAAHALAKIAAVSNPDIAFPGERTTQWLEILQRLCLHDQLSVQHRGLVIAYNLLAADAELAKKLVESELLEILTVVGKQEPEEKKAEVVQTARECLIKCMDYGFIKPVS
ncbi:hypothetical protein H8958_022153 [Nasalis larvatus]